MTDAEVVARLSGLVRDIPDWPTPGVVFKDITPLLADAQALASTVDLLAAPGRLADGATVDLVVGIEARGFILGAPVALALGAGFVPVRKKGKLPHATLAADYVLEYGAATVEMHADAVQPGQRVLVVDDVLATGGTLAATCDLIARAGGQVVAASLLIELTFLGGRDRLGDLDLRTVLTV